MISKLFSRPFRKLKCAVALVFLTAQLAGAAEPWRLLIEPTFMHYDAAWPIEGSDRTVLVPARFIKGEIQPLKKSEMLFNGVTRQQIQAEAPPAAGDVLATLKPRYVRDSNQVILYAILESDSPITASAVLAPDFPNLFNDTLGPDFLIAIPNRNKIFVFPRLSTASQTMTDIVVAEYESSSAPVSRELFTLKKGTLTSLGTYQ